MTRQMSFCGGFSKPQQFQNKYMQIALQQTNFSYFSIPKKRQQHTPKSVKIGLFVPNWDLQAHLFHGACLQKDLSTHLVVCLSQFINLVDIISNGCYLLLNKSQHKIIKNNHTTHHQQFITKIPQAISRKTSNSDPLSRFPFTSSFLSLPKR